MAESDPANSHSNITLGVHLTPSPTYPLACARPRLGQCSPCWVEPASAASSLFASAGRLGPDCVPGSRAAPAAIRMAPRTFLFSGPQRRISVQISVLPHGQCNVARSVVAASASVVHLTARLHALWGRHCGGARTVTHYETPLPPISPRGSPLRASLRPSRQRSAARATMRARRSVAATWSPLPSVSSRE